LAEAVAWQLLIRWGVVAWDLWAHESYRVPWREVVRALRRIEARGQALGGRFVAGVSGEQYALPEAAALLADVRRDPGCGSDVVVAGADPLNLTGDLMGGQPRLTRLRPLDRSTGSVGGGGNGHPAAGRTARRRPSEVSSPVCR
jgi:ATP-dependent Lhr-like helicase